MSNERIERILTPIDPEFLQKLRETPDSILNSPNQQNELEEEPKKSKLGFFKKLYNLINNE